ncbi:hypothetical protein AB4Z34_29255 [Ensifer sp. 2YAB10]|uniref:hypothetical protein n=1 Tax=unclassified Ensifer TaxID=2633371 RepID=UPI003F90D341
MKFELSTPVLGFDGQTFEDNGKPLTIADIVKHSLREPALFDRGDQFGMPRPLTSADIDERLTIRECMKGDAWTSSLSKSPP